MIESLNNKFSLNRVKGAFWYSVFKYLEIAITSLTTFLVAKKIGPTEMGLALPVLLYITYANYLSLGVNQVILKNYSKYNSEEEAMRFLSVNFQYILFVCFVDLLFAYFFLDIRYFLTAAFVSVGYLLRSYFMCYFRVVNKMQVLNKNNLIYSTCLLFLTYFLVNNLEDYLLCWSISFALAIVLYFFDDLKFFMQLINRFFILPSKSDLYNNLKEGAKLAAVGVVGTLLLTTDRLIISRLHFSVEMKGVYQLADYAGTAYYLLFSTVLFYFYPRIIKHLRDDAHFKIKYLSYIKWAAYSLPVILLLTYLVGLGLSHWIFPEYKGLETLLLFTVFLKSGVILVTAFSTMYVAANKEMLYIKSMLLPLGAYLLIGLFFIIFKVDNIVVIPLSLGLVLCVEFLKKIKYFERN